MEGTSVEIASSKTARVGVIADTHCPEFLPALPARIGEVLAGVDLILHAGDVGGDTTLAELRRIAPVVAVRGDHDRALDLPVDRVVEVAGRRVAVVHGNRSHLVEEPFTFIGTVTLGLYWPAQGLDRYLRRRFPDADVIVHGHTHVAARRDRGGALLFNPGAVYQVDRAEAHRRLAAAPGWFEWSWLQVIRHRRAVPAPSVGILTFTEGGIAAEVVPL